MRVLVFIDDQTALAAICQFLSLSPEKTVSSKKQFTEIVRSYVRGYGDLCVDDHQTECSRYSEAEEITNKYYK